MNVVEATLRRVDAAQQRHLVPGFLFGVMKKYGDDNAGALTVQVTYSFVVTIFPLLLLLVTLLGIVLADNPDLRHRVLNSAFGQFPVVGTEIAHNVHAMRRDSTFGLLVGLLGLGYGATSLAQSGLYAMEQIWNIPSAARPNYITRMIRSILFLLVLAVGLIVTTGLAGFGTFGHHNFLLGLLGEPAAGLVNIGLYFATFRVLTPKQVPARSLVPGVIIGGIAWTVLQALGGYVVGHNLRGASAVYGVFGLFLGL
ncbi:MAG: YhjD/YihY/BrkB family envelope integrity protein, partial [Acidimicrobiales bacterium]